MPYELLGDQHTVNVGAIAHVEEHVGDTGCGGLLERGQDAPYSIHLLLHLFLVMFHQVPFLFRSICIALVVVNEFGAGRGETNVPELVYHVAFGMPMLVLPVSEDLDKLLEDRCLASCTSLRKLR